jgi:hypothetical protein
MTRPGKTLYRLVVITGEPGALAAGFRFAGRSRSRWGAGLGYARTRMALSGAGRLIRLTSQL